MNKEKWEVIRNEGKKNYVLNYGLHGGSEGWIFFGLFSVLFAILSNQLDFEPLTFSIGFGLGYPIVSFLVGFYRWNQHEKQYGVQKE